MSNPVAEIFDVFFNRRPAPKDIPPKPQVDWPALIRRKTSRVRVQGKMYRVTVEKETS